MNKEKQSQESSKNSEYDQWRNSNNQDAMPKTRNPPRAVPGRPVKK